MIGLDIYGRIDEIQRATWLVGQLADVQAQGATLLLRDGECVRHLRWVGETWQCDCTFSRTHDRQTDLCRHVRALEIWHKNGALADPRLMILDETLFMGNRRFFVPGSSRQMTYEAISERWRCIAQAYARRQTGWDVVQIEAWYTVVTLSLICPYIWLTGLRGILSLRLALAILSLDLPDWFAVLYEIKRASISLLREPDWETNMAFQEAFCDWLEEEAQYIGDEQIRNEVNQIGRLMRPDLGLDIWDLNCFSQPIPVAVHAC